MLRLAVRIIAYAYWTSNLTATRTLKLLATMWMTPSSTLSSRCDLPMGESRPGKQDKSISCLGGLCANSLGSESLYCTD